MTYQTNPISTRFKVNQGWVDTFCIQEKSLYSHQTTYFYRYYIYLQFFLKKKKLSLINHSIINDNKDITLFYLLVQQKLTHYEDKYRVGIKKKYERQDLHRKYYFAKMLGFYVKYNKFSFLKENELEYGAKTLFPKNLKQLSLRLLGGYKKCIFNTSFFKTFLKKNNSNFFSWKNKFELFSKPSQINGLKKINLIEKNKLNIKLSDYFVSAKHLKLKKKRIIPLIQTLPRKRINKMKCFKIKQKFDLFFSYNYNNVSLNKKYIFNKQKLYISRKNKKQNLINLKWLKQYKNVFNKNDKKETIQHIKDYNKNLKKTCKIKKNKCILTANKQKEKKVKQLSFDIVLYTTGLYLQTELRKLFNRYYFLKFEQNLHKIISTEFLLTGQSRMNVWQFAKYPHIRIKNSILRSCFIFYKYQNLDILSQIMKSLFETNQKKHRVFFEFFKTLIWKVSPQEIENIRLIVRGKINSRPRARTAAVGFVRFQEPNSISLHKYKNKLDYTEIQADAQTGSFFLKIVSEIKKTRH